MTDLPEVPMYVQCLESQALLTCEPLALYRFPAPLTLC